MVNHFKGIGLIFEDKLLLRNFKRGSKDALQRIYEKYRDDLLRFAVSLCGDSNLAEDIVHDVFISFVRRAKKIEVKNSLKNYLITSVVNRLRSLSKSKQKNNFVNIEDIKPPAAELKRPDQWVILSEQIKQLSNALSQLSYEQRETVLLRIHGPMKFAQIAELQGTSVKTAISRYRYGLNKLRSILNSEVQK